MMTTTAPDPATAIAGTATASPAAATGTSSPSHLSDGDPRLSLATAVGFGAAVIAGVNPRQFHGPTPASDLAVRDLVGHMVGTLRLVAAAGRGEAISTAPAISGLPDAKGVEGGWVDANRAEAGWVEAWNQAGHEVQAAWADPDVLERTMVLPFGQLRGAEVLAVYAGRLTVQTWDLAITTHQRPGWDVGSVAAALVATGWAGPPTR
jgi:uncharacterized protein (TIGR03086 family)